MAFTYDATVAADRDMVRLKINDKVEGSGPLPADANFSDAELDAILEIEGTWQRAVASCFEAMAAAWVKYPSFQADNFSISRSHIVKNLQDEAREWRKRYGYPGGSTLHSRSMIRVDGYSDDIASDEVT